MLRHQEVQLDEEHEITLPSTVVLKKQQAEDILTIFSELCYVNLCYLDGRSQTL